MRTVGLSVLLACLGCGQPQPVPAVTYSVEFQAHSLEDRPGLHNLWRVDEKLYSGSSPEGEAGFDSLAKLDVRTIISVDGAPPNYELARRHGMRYVHLPVGYGGITQERVYEIAKVIRDLPAMVYIHCHHGKHRGPTAAVSASLCLNDRCSVESAISLMKRMGTDERYQGLYRVPAAITRPSLSTLDQIASDWPEVAKSESIVRVMVQIDERFDSLKSAQKSGWKQADAAHQTLLLKEHYVELTRDPGMLKRPEEFRDLLAAGVRQLTSLEDHLRMKADAKILDQDLAGVRVNCQNCHQRYRD